MMYSCKVLSTFLITFVLLYEVGQVPYESEISLYVHYNIEVSQIAHKRLSVLRKNSGALCRIRVSRQRPIHPCADSTSISRKSFKIKPDSQ